MNIRRLRAAALAASLLAAAAASACSGDATGGKKPAAPTLQSLSLRADTVFLSLGGRDTLTVTLHYSDGSSTQLVPTGHSVLWASSNLNVAKVDSVGQMVHVSGTYVGTSTITATLDGVSGSAQVAVVPPAAGVVPVAGSGQTGPVNGPVGDSVAFRVVDQYGQPVRHQAVTFSAEFGGSASPASALSDAAGLVRTRWTLGSAGPQRLFAAIPQGTGAAEATAVGGPPVTLDAISPDTLRSGQPAVLTGAGFDTAAAKNNVRIDGTLATVLTASATQLTVRVPDQGCRPTRPVYVSVANTSRAAQVTGATASVSAALGFAADVPAGSGDCLELPPGTRWEALVTNTGSRALGFSFSWTPVLADRASAPAALRARAIAFPHLSRSARVRALATHLDVLERGRALVRRLGALPRAPRRARAAAAVVPAVGDERRLLVPALTRDDPCQTTDTARARVVYVGEHVLVLKDERDGLYDPAFYPDWEREGRELDQVQLPIIRASFGDPLKLDGQLDGDGRVTVFITTRVNDLGEGLGGFVWPGDLYPKSACAGSNQDEVFYARAPTDSSEGFERAGTLGEWHWLIRSTLIHETKHLAAVAEKLSRGATVLEDSWLEESSARLAEELYARQVHHFAAGSNAGWAQVKDELSFKPGPEVDPLIMLNHFADLYDYESELPQHTPLGSATPGDYTFYGSGWSLLRWAVDHSGRDEGAFLRELTAETHLVGGANLAARAGRPFDAMLRDWTTSLVVDDAGYPTAPEFAFPAWNLRDVFAGLAHDVPWSFPSATPLLHSVTPVSLPPGGSQLFTVVSGSPAATVIRFPSPPPELRLRLVRVP